MKTLVKGFKEILVNKCLVWISVTGFHTSVENFTSHENIISQSKHKKNSCINPWLSNFVAF